MKASNTMNQKKIKNHSRNHHQQNQTGRRKNISQGRENNTFKHH